MNRAELLADDPIWLIAIKCVVLLLAGAILTLFMVIWERKVIARMQHRPGPNRVGPNGWLQSLADGIKLPFKEQIIPDTADRKVYFLAPILSTIPAFLALSVLPFGGQVSIFGEQTVLQLVDLPVGVLVLLACSSMGVYGIVLAGWSSGSPYPLLGGLRSAAQVISYEIAMGLSIVAVILYSGSLSTGDIVDAQASRWYFFMLIPSFVIYMISMVGETNRAPFDLPEAESELVGGFHTEYSSMKFALFFLAEYVNMVIVSAFCTTMFFGGYLAPWPLSAIGDGMLNTGWWGVLWFVLKTLMFLFIFIWLRGTLPRMRYDQFMQLGWKVLVPINLVWIMGVVTLKALREATQVDYSTYLIIGGVAVAVLIAVVFLLPDRREPIDDGVPLIGSGYPVPPLDLEVPGRPKPVKARRRRESVTSGAPAGVETPPVKESE